MDRLHQLFIDVKSLFSEAKSEKSDQQKGRAGVHSPMKGYPDSPGLAPGIFEADWWG